MSESAPPPGADAPAEPPPPEGLLPDASSADRVLLGSPSRQSPVAVVFIAWRFVKNLGMANLVIAFVILFSGRLSSYLFLAGSAVAVAGLVFMVIAWWRFVFAIDGDELHVTKGVIAEERLTIPLNRVQSVSIDQKFLHRPIGLVSASVDTAGSSDTEFTIDAIDRPRAEALQRLAAGYRRSTPAGEVAAVVVSDGTEPDRQAPDERLIHRSVGDLVKIGATRWPWAGLVALAPLIAVLDDIGEFLPIDLPSEETVGNTLPAEFGLALVAYLLVGTVTLIVAGAVLGTLLQVVREVTTNWDLTLTHTSTGFRRTAGLLSTTSRASTLQRIQAVQTDESPAQRLVGIRKLTMPTIGEGDLVVPGTTEHELGRLRRIVFGDDRPATLDRMISRRFVFLEVRNAALVVVPAAVLIAVGTRWWALLLLVFLPIQWLTARRRWRLRRWGLTDDRMAESYELVSRHTAEIELIKAQAVTVSQSFFERRRGLATVRVDTAEGHLAVPLIDHDDAKAVRDRVLHVAETDRRRWM